MQNKQGFTLIEILLALAVIAIAITALLKTSAQAIYTNTRLQEKSTKHWIAMQAISQVQMQSLQISNGLPTTKAFKAFGKTWYFRVSLQQTNLSKIQKLTVDVSANHNGPFTDPITAFYHEK